MWYDFNLTRKNEAISANLFLFSDRNLLFVISNKIKVQDVEVGLVQPR